MEFKRSVKRYFKDNNVAIRFSSLFRILCQIQKLKLLHLPSTLALKRLSKHFNAEVKLIIRTRKIGAESVVPSMVEEG